MAAAPAKQFPIGKFGLGWVLGLLAIVVVLEFGKFDDTTVLVPDRTNALLGSFALAAVFGFVSAGIGFYESRELSIVRRAGIAIAFWLLGAVATLFLFNAVISTGLNRIDFPPATTQINTSLIAISRAYQTSGKRRDWNIQTMPIWSNMHITKDDYDFMLQHRSPSDTGNDENEVSSDGYFCARVTIQKSGENMRVMNAGERTLPKGTIGICPTR